MDKVRTTLRIAGMGLAIFVLGIILGFTAYKSLHVDSRTHEETAREIHLGPNKLINPLLECRLDKKTGHYDFASLEDRIKEKVLRETVNNRISDLAVYYQDLNSGVWFGINEEMDFCPASLLKVPIMIFYFKMAETNPSLLRKKITYTPSRRALNNEKSDLVTGQSYTIEEYIEQMIINSDNEALNVLVSDNSIPDSLAKRINLALGIQAWTQKTPDDFISAKEYASYFRILYNSTYLSMEASEKALDLLSRTRFFKGLAGGLPKNITVAHKHGQWKAIRGDNREQLHDCGIVYHSERPYLLCIMSRGWDFEKLGDSIRDVSSLVYNYVSGHRFEQAIGE